MAARAPPQTPLEELATFYALLEPMGWKMNLLPLLISWLRHCGISPIKPIKPSRQKLPFLSKMHYFRWRLRRSSPQTLLWELTALTLTLTVRGGEEGHGEGNMEEERKGEGSFPNYLNFLATPVRTLIRTRTCLRTRIRPKADMGIYTDTDTDTKKWIEWPMIQRNENHHFCRRRDSHYLLRHFVPF